MRTAYLSWFAVALFYFYQYILRVAPGVMVDQLMTEFQIKAEEFGTLGSLDTFAYALLQIPLGIIVDRVGVKKVVMCSVSLCTLGAMLFGISENFWIVQLSRLITGTGSAAAFMCALKSIADNFPPGQRGMLMGLTLTMGVFGALVAGKVIILIMYEFDWRFVMLFATVLGLIIGIMVYFMVDGKAVMRKIKHQNDWHAFRQSLLGIIKNPNVIIYSILAIGLYVPLAVLADLWGTAFLKQKFGFTQAEGAHLSSLLYLGLGIGSIILPWWSERLNLINISIFLCSIFILFIFSAIVYGPTLSYSGLAIMLIIMGFFCGAEMMCFTGALMSSDETNSGEIIGVVNTFNMLGAAILKYNVGYALDASWSGAMQTETLRHYSTSQYTAALSSLTWVLSICCCLAFLSLFKAVLLKKKYRRI